MNLTIVQLLNFGCVTHLYALFNIQQRKKCTRVRRNEDAITIKAGLIKTIENTKSCSDKQNSF